jgi:hypothetical protein
MRKNPLIQKSWAIGTILLFLGTSIIPFADSLPVEKENILVPKSCSDVINISISGHLGDNGWYVSVVTVTLSGGNYTFIRVDNENWIVYTAPFTISTDGIHLIEATDDFEHIVNATVKIDRTPPIWDNYYIENIGFNRYIFHANVTDTASGINKVDFYLNYFVIFTDYTAPYEWVYKGPSFFGCAVAFDYAGNSDINQYIPSPPMDYFAIGFIKEPQVCKDYVTFFAIFVIVYEHFFPFFGLSTLTNQQFAIPTHYAGNISDNFIIVRFSSCY